MCYDHVLPPPRSPIAVAGQLVRDIPDRHHSLACEAAKLLRDLHNEKAKLRAACELLVGWSDYEGDAVAMLDDAVDAARKALGDAGGEIEEANDSIWDEPLQDGE